MSKLNTVLKTVPAIDKQELLFYIAANFPDSGEKLPKGNSMKTPGS
ncbi:hypothetical protein Niako_2755 [Niastella koreensis GR20-10]|uniref:Uncharacterized protein n=1 Tax=Niastella koreensis (strain DSM 17620 / KACC 11465 / NBRC 106392 / GR20-10) TaxID=700598 RepID=G8T8C1_NIAKG|nr:hypothetical protein Niako_2755 [Niastella koreensis GR20-10]